jgi:hypothetical protein
MTTAKMGISTGRWRCISQKSEQGVAECAAVTISYRKAPFDVLGHRFPAVPGGGMGDASVIPTQEAVGLMVVWGQARKLDLTAALDAEGISICYRRADQERVD